ncbi:MAG: DUF4321 domain-containing protein [Leptospirillia bacterium]
MAILRKTSNVLLGFVFAGALLGGVLAEALRHFSSEGLLREVFLKGYGIGIDPPFTIDLHLFSLTAGLTFDINLFVILGALLGVLVYRQV